MAAGPALAAALPGGLLALGVPLVGIRRYLIYLMWNRNHEFRACWPKYVLVAWRRLGAHRNNSIIEAELVFGGGAYYHTRMWLLTAYRCIRMHHLGW